MKQSAKNFIPYTAKEHHKHPLMMNKGNLNNVWLNTGAKLVVHTGPKGSYVVYIDYQNKQPVFVNVSKLYKEIFTHTGQVVFSKGQLRNQNRAGRYEAPLRVPSPTISMSGYILKGKNIGKKLSELSVNSLIWYFEKGNLTPVEITELEKEISRREKSK